MKNLKIFVSANMQYITSFVIFSIISFIVAFVFMIDINIYLYKLMLVFFALFVISLVRFVKLKKALQVDDFTFFNNNLYEKHIGDLYKKKQKEVNDIRLSSYLKEEELDKLLAIWTHQIKTPISAISLISERYKDNEINAELIKIDDYIASLLSLMKLRGSSLDYNFKSFSIEKIVRDIVKRYRTFFIEKKLAIKIDIEDEFIISDPKWISFVIEQILFNSIKYTDKGYISISYKKNILEITDTGIGIKKEDIENIKKFGYSGDTEKRDANSTGIGLYLVDDILTKLGYTYKILSKPDEGTSVLINLKRTDIIKD